MELISNEEKERIVDLICAYMDREKDIDVCVDVLRITHQEFKKEFPNINFKDEAIIAEIKASYNARINARNNPWESMFDTIEAQNEK